MYARARGGSSRRGRAARRRLGARAGTPAGSTRREGTGPLVSAPPLVPPRRRRFLCSRTRSVLEDRPLCSLL